MSSHESFDSFDNVMRRLQAGDQTAAAELFQRFARRLLSLARSHLDQRVKSKVDEEDMVQSVFRSFFVRQAEGQFTLQDWDGLWSLLARIMVRKCIRQRERFGAQRRELARELRLTAMGERSWGCGEIIDHDPEPAAPELAIMRETLEQVMRGLDELQRQMVILRLQGYTISEISQQTGRTERTVHRVLSLVREGLTCLAEE